VGFPKSLRLLIQNRKNKPEKIVIDNNYLIKIIHNLYIFIYKTAIISIATLVRFTNLFLDHMKFLDSFAHQGAAAHILETTDVYTSYIFTEIIKNKTVFTITVIHIQLEL